MSEVCDALRISKIRDTRMETNQRAICGAVNQPGEEMPATRGSFPLSNRALRTVERLWQGARTMSRDDVATQLAGHEAVCAERRKQASGRATAAGLVQVKKRKLP